MKFIVAVFAFAAALVLGGCASTGVVPTDDGKYVIAKQSPQVGFGPPIAARAEVYQQANEFCAKDGKTVETINLVMTDSGLGRSAAVSLEFRCKPKG